MMMPTAKTLMSVPTRTVDAHTHVPITTVLSLALAQKTWCWLVMDLLASMTVVPSVTPAPRSAPTLLMENTSAPAQPDTCLLRMDSDVLMLMNVLSTTVDVPTTAPTLTVDSSAHVTTDSNSVKMDHHAVLSATLALTLPPTKSAPTPQSAKATSNLAKLKPVGKRVFSGSARDANKPKLVLTTSYKTQELHGAQPNALKKVVYPCADVVATVDSATPKVIVMAVL